MRVGIVGTGNMGKVIGVALARQGHEVFFGARDLAKIAGYSDEFAIAASIGSNQQAAEFAEVVYYNPRDVHPQEVLDDLDCLTGKAVICSHNGVVPSNFEFATIHQSKAEALQQQIPHAHVVTAFNTITQETFELSGGELKALNVCCLLASNHEPAKQLVSQLVSDIGFNPADCGSLNQSRLIEGAADLVRMLMYKANTPWKALSFIDLPQVEQQFSYRIASKLHDVVE